VQLNLHCSPPAISSHDQPDNGTFELYAFGDWVMPDSGFYTYGHDPGGRTWHRRTAVHQTLTLDGQDSACAGHHLLWHGSPELDTVVVANHSYPALVHRRSVWFVKRSWFVLLDEALGSASGVLDLHFQFAPGQLLLEPEAGRAITRTDWGAATPPPAAEATGQPPWSVGRVLLRTVASAPLLLGQEEGRWGWAYGVRELRPACFFRHPAPAPAAFLTVIVPFRGDQVPAVKAELPADLQPGAERVELVVEVDGRRWRVGRDLATGSAWLG
jgi:heparan-sulfate lyase